MPSQLFSLLICVHLCPSVVKPFRLLLFIGFLFVSLVVRPAFCDPVGLIPCKMIQHRPRLELESPAFEFVLDTSGGLRARSWKNRFTGSQVSLSLGPEVELDFDTAEQRIWISGWKEDLPNRITHFFLPLEAQGKKLSLTLGGLGLYDYDRIDVSINGH